MSDVSPAPDSARSPGRTRFVVVGGFLGAGKTTALIELAQGFVRDGLTVGIVANDQAGDLVDTATFRAAGFDTDEVGGGCFCCRFDDLIAAADRLGEAGAPDVLLAEPVGSCTDVVSTVIRPLERAYAARFDVAPYVVLLDPERAWHALTGRGPAGFSAKVTYIFRTQQHEADVVAINKIDTLDPERVRALTDVVRRNFPQADVACVSARTGAGFDTLRTILAGRPPAARHAIEVDYDVYAEAEARLAWLNARIELSDPPDDGAALLTSLLGHLAAALADAGIGPVRAKAALHLPGTTWIANLLAADGSVETVGRPAPTPVAGPVLLLNARAEAVPQAVEASARSALRKSLAGHGVEATALALRCFAPPRPVPTHPPAGLTPRE